MPDLTEAQRERMAEALLTWWLEGLDADDAAYLTSDEGTHLMAEQYASRLAPVVAAVADEAAAEALGLPDDSVVVALDDFKTLRAEAKAYAAMVGKVRTLADEWDGNGHGRYNVHLEERLPCPACDLLAELRALLEADQ